MARPPLKNRFGLLPQQVDAAPVLISEVRLNGGMNTYIDSADLPTNMFTELTNASFRGDTTGRARGTIEHGPDEPNTDPILLYTNFLRFNGNSVYLRFTKDKIYRQGESDWTEITPADDPFSMSEGLRPKFTTMNDRFFFTPQNGPIMEIDFENNTYAPLGNAESYKYITGFFNRIVGANLYHATSPNPTLIGWSGDVNFDEWDPFVDISAGSTPLLEAATDFADPITGLFGFAATMLILRERSLWTATKRGVASSPFIFQASFPNVGCDTPGSAAQRKNGIVWYDHRSNQVYSYTIGERPEPIGNAVKYDILRRITDKDLIQGGFDPILNEYHLVIPSTSSTLSYIFVFSFETNAWRQRTLNNCFGMYGMDGQGSGLVIDELKGTIDNLLGVIDDLGVEFNALPSSVFYGLDNGKITVEAVATDTDLDAELLFEAVSKMFTFPTDDISVSRLHMEIECIAQGHITLQYSKDAGKTWKTYKTVTWDETDVGTRKRIICTKHIRSRQYMWKLTSSAGAFNLLEYSIQSEKVEFTHASSM